MADLAWAVMISVFMICITMGGLKECDQDHALKLKCMEKNWVINLRGECEPPSEAK